jgi:hypothetical protein
MPGMTAYNPTLRQKTQALLQQFLEQAGMSRYQANRQAYNVTGGGDQNMGVGLLDFTPAGLVYGAQEGAQAIDRGMTMGGVDGAIEGGMGLLEVGLNALPAAAATRPLARCGAEILKTRALRAQ